MRDTFAVDPAGVLVELSLGEADHHALVALPFADLEVQADILLRKRFDLVRRWMPRTCAEAGWEAFRLCTRNHPPSEVLQDARRFGESLAASPLLDARERNRVCFLAGTVWFSLHWNASPAGMQIFFRWRGGWREFFFAVRL